MSNAVTNSILTELGQRLVSGSLSDASLMRASADTPDFAILPWANVVKIGGQSIMDRGRVALMPVVDEIVANLPRHKMILGHLGGYAGAAYLQPGHPRQFLERHGSGARFSVLPAPIRAAALHQASDWATERFGSLDALFRESVSYELSFFQPQPVKPH